MVLFFDLGEGCEFVHVCVEVLEFGVIAEVDCLQRVVVEVDSLYTGQQVRVEVSKAI